MDLRSYGVKVFLGECLRKYQDNGMLFYQTELEVA